VTRVTAVVPARNESGRVGATVAALLGIEGVSDVVVVDDGSTDGSAAEAEAAGARVIRLPRSRGKGAALDEGVAATDAEVIMLVDADLAGSARALAAVLGPVLDGEADLAIAAPPRAGGPSGFGLVESFARWGIERLAARRLDRPLSGQRAVRREVLGSIGRFAPGFGVDTGFTLDALRAGYRVIEVPCSFTHAATGRDAAGFLHRARQGADVARALAVRTVRRRKRP